MASNINYNSYYGYYGIDWADSSNNNNIIYSGKASDGNIYRSRIILNTTGMQITSSSRLIVKITVAQQGTQYYGDTVARLSTYNLTNPRDYFKDDGYTPIDNIINNTIASSNFYTNSDGSILATSNQAENNTLYLIFNTNNKIKADNIYYIYIGREGTLQSRFNAFKISEINLDYISYSKCIKPTVKAEGVIIPNGTFTVSWSGAQAGNGQTIIGYDVYYIITSSKTAVPSTTSYTDKISISSRSSSGSVKITINASETQRGYYIKCGIVTKGSAGPAYYSPIGVGGAVIINNLPSKPSSIETSSDIVPSSGGFVTFTLKYTSSEEGQINSIWYSSSLTGARTKISGSSVKLEVKKTTTYYFWTHDGIEYSADNINKTISVNTIPTCSINLSGDSVASNYNSSINPYIITPELKISEVTGGQSNNKYTLWIQYSDEVNFSTYSEKQIKTNYTSTSYLINNIRKELPDKRPPYYYRAAVIRNDGIENSNKIISSQIYYINTVPAIINIFNNSDYQNIAELDGYFDKKLSFYFEYDESYSAFTLSTGKKIVLTHDETKKLTYGQIDDAGYSDSGLITIEGYYDDNIKFSYTHKDSVGDNYKIYKVEKFDINNLVIDKFVPWDNKKGNFSITNRFQDTTFTSEVLKRFGITSIEDCFKYFIEGQSSVAIQPTSSSSSYSTLFFEPTWNTSDLDTDTDYNKTVTVRFINNFGTVSEGYGTLYIRYKVDPIIQNFSCNQLSTAQLKEGNALSFNLKATNCYNSGQKAEIYAIISGTERLLSTWTLSSLQGEIDYNSTLPLIYELKEIKDEEEITAFKVKITNNAGTTAEQTLIDQAIVLLKHTAPSVSLIRTDYQTKSAYGEVVVYFNPNNWGLGKGLYDTDNNIIELTLYKDGVALATTIDSESPVDKNDSSYTFILTNALGEEGWETANIYLKVSVTNNTNSIKTTYTQTATNSVIVYNLTPTIAYRKNYLGINTKNPDLDDSAIMIIGNASGRDKIIYTTADNTHPVCVLVNFKIDGGSWD